MALVAAPSSLPPARPQTSGTLVPPDSSLRAFGLLDPAGQLKNRPKLVRCPQCAERAGADGGGLLCVIIADGCGNTVLCYYHSKGKFKNDTPRGRWLLASLPQGARSRIICDHGHVCEITL